MFDVANEQLNQGLTGQFLTPDVRAQRASQVLREEEEQKILTGSP
jgi:hypothetical protein